MIAFLAENLGTIVISLALIGVVSAISAKLATDKRKGKRAGCGGCNGCSGCSGCDAGYNGSGTGMCGTRQEKQI